MRLAMWLALFLAFGPAPAFLSAQTQLTGVWEGHLTVGGLQSQSGYHLSLHLTKRGSTVSGRAYVHLAEGQVTEMALTGYIYADNSVYLEEVAPSVATGQHTSPTLRRKYQLVFKRGIYDSSLNGYWQEVHEEVLHEQRQRGRVFLRPTPSGKA